MITNKVYCALAWITSSAAITAAKGTGTSTLTVAKGTADGETRHIDISIASTTNPEMSDSSGKTYYVVNGVKKENTSESRVTIGVYEVSVEWQESDAATLWNLDTTKTTDTTLTVYVQAASRSSGEASAVLLKNTASGPDGGKDANKVEAVGGKYYHAVVITIASDGDLEVTSVNGADGATGKFAVRPGLEGNTAEDWGDTDGTGQYASLLAINTAAA